jgi:hypothetical protein
MARMGHDSPAAALVYQHASSVADRAIADAVDRALRGSGRSPGKAPEGGSGER